MSWLHYARLLRLPNVFTAFADIAVGALITLHLGLSDLWPNLLALALASGCLYSAGMVFNDYFDLEEDRRDRPFRPIPSGRVSARTALLIGSTLMAVGCVAAGFAGVRPSGWEPTPLIVAGALVGLILAYDAWLKHTPAGPFAMGGCRSLNVLLGLSLLPADVFPWEIRAHIAAAVGVYIAGVTLFARTEERTSRQGPLFVACGVILTGLLIALGLPLHREFGTTPAAFPYLLVAFGFGVGLPVERAIRKPGPTNVQRAVKLLILGLVVFDATIAFAFVGWPGLLIVLLLPPGLLLGKRVYST